MKTMTRTIDIPVMTRRFHELAPGVTPREPQTLLFTASRDLTDAEIVHLSSLIGYAWRASLAGESLPLGQRVDARSFTIDVDDTKSRRSEIADAWDQFLENVAQYMKRGTPMRLSDRAGAGTKGTRLVYPPRDAVALTVWADSVYDPAPDPVQVAAAAMEAFWAKVAELCPNATSGDVPPVLDERFTTMTETAVRTWITYNH